MDALTAASPRRSFADRLAAGFRASPLSIFLIAALNTGIALALWIDDPRPFWHPLLTVQVYGLDFGSAGLRLLETLPHVGAIVDGDDSERVARLLGMIRSIIDERTERFGAVRAGSIAEYRTISGSNDEPRILQRATDQWEIAVRR